MKIVARGSVCALAVLVVAVSSLAQRMETPAERQTRESRDLSEEKMRNPPPADSDFRPVKPSPELYELRRQRVLEYWENMAMFERMLAVPGKFTRKYSEFLKRKNTGIFRIFPDRGCFGSEKTVSVADLESCAGTPPLLGGGSHFSFRQNSPISGPAGWDIHFEDGRFTVGNDTVQGIVAKIGPVELDKVDHDLKVFDFLEGFSPSSSVAEIATRTKELERGVSANGFVYSNAVSVEINCSYALRIVSYRLNGEIYDKRSKGQSYTRGHDITLALKVIETGDDGSLIVLWRALDRAVIRRTLAKD